MSFRGCCLFTCSLSLLATPYAAAQTGALAPGEIVVTEFYRDFFRIDPATGTLTEVPGTPFTFVSEIGIDPQNRIIGMQVNNINDQLLVRFDPATGLANPLTTQTFSSVEDLAVEADGSVLLIEGDNLIRIDPVTGRVSTLVDSDQVNGGFFAPSHVAVGSDGRIFMLEFFENLYEIDPLTGNATKVPILNNGLRPEGIFGVLGVQPDGDLIVKDDGNLFSVHPDTGFFELFTENIPTFTDDIAIDADGNVFIVSSDGVHRVDAQGGSLEAVVARMTFFSPDEIVVAGAFVPEPSSLALLLGAGAFLMRRRR